MSTFSPDGRWLDYLSDESGRPETVRRAVRAWKNYRIMPDGKRFVMIERQQPGMPQHVNLVLNWFGDLQKRMAAQR